MRTIGIWVIEHCIADAQKCDKRYTILFKITKLVTTFDITGSTVIKILLNKRISDDFQKSKHIQVLVNGLS